MTPNELKRYALTVSLRRSPATPDARALRAVLRESADAVLVVGRDARVKFANPAAGVLFGRADHKLIGTDFGFPLVVEDHTEIDIVRPDGKARFADMRVVRTQWERESAFIVTLRDTTERRELETRLASAERLEALGRLAGGVAHDFNNMLTSLMCEADVLIRELERGAARRERVEQIRTITARASRLTNQLLTFSRRQVTELEYVDMNAVVLDIAAMLRPLFGERVKLECAVAPAPLLVHVNRTQLEQVVMNLALNAKDAASANGRVTIGTRPSRSASRLSQRVELFVRDNGCGMSAEVQERLFEPFFTTKQARGGTGLGLSVVYGIVQQSGGEIELTSELDVGTEFRVLLPEVAAPSKAVETVTPAQLAKESPRRILLAEDEAAIREIVCEILEQAGHTVIVADDGDDAWRILEEQGPVDLLISDVMMPGMSGIELTELLLRQWSQSRVILVSGYASNLEALRAQLDHDTVTFLHKPFSPDELLQCIDHVLRSTPAHAADAALS